MSIPSPSTISAIDRYHAQGDGGPILDVAVVPPTPQVAAQGLASGVSVQAWASAIVAMGPQFLPAHDNGERSAKLGFVPASRRTRRLQS